uniref:Putative Rep n=1 Tax=Pteris mastrevirus A TaxID=2809268 RepID=A0A890CB32_9GEMI|nr:putative Rep [Pteris mastrevirus A]
MLRKSLYIVGPSRAGKTTWARSLGAHNYWNGGIDLSTYNIAAQYNIIDDIPLQFVNPFKSIIGIQSDYIVNPKYGKRKVIKETYPTSSYKMMMRIGFPSYPNPSTIGLTPMYKSIICIQDNPFFNTK